MENYGNIWGNMGKLWKHIGTYGKNGNILENIKT